RTASKCALHLCMPIIKLLEVLQLEDCRLFQHNKLHLLFLRLPNLSSVLLFNFRKQRLFTFKQVNVYSLEWLSALNFCKGVRESSQVVPFSRWDILFNEIPIAYACI